MNLSYGVHVIELEKPERQPDVSQGSHFRQHIIVAIRGSSAIRGIHLRRPSSLHLCRPWKGFANLDLHAPLQTLERFCQLGPSEYLRVYRHQLLRKVYPGRRLQLL